MGYDALLIHPPSIYDFRKRIIFPGLIAYTAGQSTEQFIIPPIGMLSIADYLDRNGYKVIVDNLGERMLASESFDAEEHIRNTSARIYAIGLHWCVHSQGAIEVAKLCKKLHPDALVILGGLTATVFAEEIIQKYEFIDAIIRGEAEKPFLSLIKALEQHKPLEEVPNLTFQIGKSKVISNPLMKPVDNLDEFNFTRFDLMEPKGAIYGPGWPPHWSIPICRGCVYNCVACGGSAYSYKTHLGRQSPAFRSPGKIVKDIKKLRQQGVRYAFLCQDPRMGGEGYWRSLLKRLYKAKFKDMDLSFELFIPADEEYIKGLLKIGSPISLTISPESGVDRVRRAHGRHYTNKDLFKTIEICKKYDITLGVFSMIPLAEDNPETIRETWNMWERVCSIGYKGKEIPPVHYVLGQMILLDPGSLAFELPAKYGYRLIFNNFEDYFKGMSCPSWTQWLSYETQYLNKDLLMKLIIDSTEYSINLRERFGLYSNSVADAAHQWFVNANRLLINVMEQINSIQDDCEKMERLKAFRDYLGRNLPHHVYV
jgi:B12-binding domain/radical SAM domain protein